MIKVLLFAANPRGSAPLDLPREFREINEEIRLSTFRDAMELILVPGTRPVDLLRKLNESQPQVVHFSSHGSSDEILLEAEGGTDEAAHSPDWATRSSSGRDMKTVGPDEFEGADGPGQPHPVRGSALADVLRSCDEGNLRLVVLNACDSRPQAEALTEVVDCVVSMNRTITDRAAIKFAASFYGALAFGRSVKKAFDQGVARLRAEGIAESGTPELLVRAGVDASRVVLVGSEPGKTAQPANEVPFLVPFPRNADFVGRDEDLARLHACLSGSGPVGIRPAGLTGMGGIGKTQLAVEYVHCQRDDYPGGVFWIDAAGSLAEGFARLAVEGRLKWAEPDRPRDEQIRSAFAALNRRPDALFVLDNLPDPAMIAVSVLPGCTPEDLHCRLLFTTRRHDLGRFVGVEVTVLPEEPARRLLLRHPSRRAALEPSHPDHQHARAIARMLGRLPLALELAGAYLGKLGSAVSLESYREGLRSEGALATLDADAAEVSEADLRSVHDPAVAATIREQWETMGDDSARLLLRVASLFPESAAVPIARLGLLAGLGDEPRPGWLSPLHRAVKRLDDACLVERLEGDQLRLHPLIREFAVGRTPPELAGEFRRECMTRAAVALEDFPTLQSLESRRGVDCLQEDLIAILELCPSSASSISARLQALLRLLQREAHNLRAGDMGDRPLLLAQQVRNRAFLLGITSLQFTTERWLRALGQPHFRLVWTASRESPALVRTFTGHKGYVWAVAVTPDGRQAISGSEDCALKLWDLTTGQPRLTLSGHEGPVCALAILPDGRQALSGSADGTLRIWDLRSGWTLAVFGEHQHPVSSLAITPDGRRAASGSRDGTVRLWDLSRGQVLLSFAGNESSVSALALTPGGRQAIAAFFDGKLKFWDLTTGEVLRTVAAHGSPVYAVAVTPDGHWVLSGSLGGTLRLWDLFSGQLVTDLPVNKDAVHQVYAPVYALAVTPDGRHVLSGSGDSTLRLLDLNSRQICRSFVGHEGGVTAVAVTPDGRHALSGSADETVKLWDLSIPQPDGPRVGHEKGVTALAVTPDGRRALSASRDSTMKLWDLATRQPHSAPARHKDWVTALAVSPDGRHAISGCEDCVVRLWDLETDQLRGLLTGHTGAVTAVAVSPDGRRVLSGSKDSTIRLWDLTNNQMLITIMDQDSSVSAVAITPDGGQALSGLFDGRIMLWDLRSGQTVLAMSGHRSRVTALAILPDGRRAISGSRDSSLRLWDLQTGLPCLNFTGHHERVTAVAVTPDGNYALSGSEDRTLRLWSIEDSICRAMTPLANAPMAIAVAPDGRTVMVGDRIGNVHQFSLYVN
jgi:WD40 repeat protein